MEKKERERGGLGEALLKHFAAQPNLKKGHN